MIPDINERSAEIFNLIDRNRMNYDNVLVNIEDKKQRKLLMNCLKIDIKLLYMQLMIEGKLTEDGLFDTNVDVVALSSNNIISIFVHAYISIQYPVLDNSFVETKILTLMYTIMTNMGLNKRTY